MDTPLVVRFHERQAYDINIDAKVVTMMATTGVGTYFGNMVMDSYSRLRDKRKEFQDYVLQCIEEGIPPHEAEFD